MGDVGLQALLERRRCREVIRRLIPGCVQMVVFVAAGFSLCKQEKLEEKYSIGRNSVLVKKTRPVLLGKRA